MTINMFNIYLSKYILKLAVLSLVDKDDAQNRCGLKSKSHL